ncbi:DNA-3-methyladenine glycosylase I [Shimia biformata]|uniref:DNA-3-methyladenine glycosylase I n=1 Tax=Shimia biformata TaxID=1294299 RepID=UPI001950F760|nr:DNA-3-methyladenine glycosylase I [Shimia biformata]
MTGKQHSGCGWEGVDPIYVRYHDSEWGVPEWDGRALWEKLILDGFQAGLSWITILKKRDNFRAAFQGFDPAVIAGWGDAEVTRLLGDTGIVRHRGKIEATITNARACMEMGGPEAFGRHVWTAVGGTPVVNRWTSLSEVPAETELSRKISKDLKQRGFKFCGPTIVYAWLQACGLVNDHLVSCPRHADISRRQVGSDGGQA